LTESNVGKEYFEILRAINDQLSIRLAQTGIEMGLSRDQISKLIFVAQGTVTGVGGNGAKNISKSV